MRLDWIPDSVAYRVFDLSDQIGGIAIAIGLFVVAAALVWHARRSPDGH